MVEGCRRLSRELTGTSSTIISVGATAIDPVDWFGLPLAPELPEEEVTLAAAAAEWRWVLGAVLERRVLPTPSAPGTVTSPVGIIACCGGPATVEGAEVVRNPPIGPPAGEGQEAPSKVIQKKFNNIASVYILSRYNGYSLDECIVMSFGSVCWTGKGLLPKKWEPFV